MRTTAVVLVSMRSRGATRCELDGGHVAGLVSVPEADPPQMSGGSEHLRLAAGPHADGHLSDDAAVLPITTRDTPRYARGKSLVLNATMEPLCVVSSRRAVVLVLSAKADLLHDAGWHYRSERERFPVPSVVRLRHYVRVPYRRRAPLSRRGVFIRDDHTCQYCGRAAENVDHVQPRSRGGPHVWENVAASCTRCNARKKDRTPQEARMALNRQPYAPSAAFWLVVAVGGVEPTWEAYLQDAFRVV